MNPVVTINRLIEKLSDEEKMQVKIWNGVEFRKRFEELRKTGNTLFELQRKARELVNLLPDEYDD